MFKTVKFPWNKCLGSQGDQSEMDGAQWLRCDLFSMSYPGALC